MSVVWCPWLLGARWCEGFCGVRLRDEALVAAYVVFVPFLLVGQAGEYSVLIWCISRL